MRTGSAARVLGVGLVLWVAAGCSSSGKELERDITVEVEVLDGKTTDRAGEIGEVAVPEVAADAERLDDRIDSPESVAEATDDQQLADEDGSFAHDQATADLEQACDGDGCGFMPPGSLTVVWANLGDKDLVSVGKRIVLEFADGTEMPETAEQEVLYNQAFKIELTMWDPSAQAPGPALPFVAQWRKTQPGLFRHPALVISPAPEGTLLAPAEAYRVTVWLGDQELKRTFRTYPADVPDLKVVDLEVDVPWDCAECDGDCEKCFPFPVHVMIMIPPGYRSGDPAMDNTFDPQWDNGQQRYPVLIGLSGVNDAGIPLAQGFGYDALPSLVGAGVVEPAVLVFPDGSVSPPYCGDGWTWPRSPIKTCHTDFMGIGAEVPNETSYVSYMFFVSKTLPEALAAKVRLRGWDDAGKKTDEAAARRASGIAGLAVFGGTRALLTAFRHPEAYGSVYGLMPALVSAFNPWTYYEAPQGDPGWADICSADGNPAYPLEPVAGGFRDLSMIDPDTMEACVGGSACKSPPGICVPEDSCNEPCSQEPCLQTGLVRDITIDDRGIAGNPLSCFWYLPWPVSNEEVLSTWCGTDVACTVDPGAPDKWRTDFDKYPFDGNIFFSTGIRDVEGPPSGFFDLDQQLDKRGVLHSFWYMDSGGVYHDWQAIYDQVIGMETITWEDGKQSPGNFPGTGALHPFFNHAFEALGNRPFNHPSASEFTVHALDPDSDRYIDLVYAPSPELSYVEDNCPGKYNPDQLDSDGDGTGDACDQDE